MTVHYVLQHLAAMLHLFHAGTVHPAGAVAVLFSR